MKYTCVYNYDYECINNKLMIELFDCLIRPILTYGEEIWICDFSIKDNNLDKLPFEKKIA